MPRYEFNEGKSSKFWEIELDGETVTTRWGRIGTAGQENAKDYDDRPAAKKEYEKLIAEKTKKGYLLVDAGGGDAPPTGKSNPELEAAILAAPDDEQRYVVYGDWLQANGDLRGELVALHVSNASKPDAEVAAKAERLIRENDEFFLGALAEHSESAQVTWRYGFLDTVRISLGYEEADAGETDIEEVIASLFAHPSARFLRGLTIGMFDYEGENHYEGIVGKLAKLGARPSLRSLFIGDFEFPEENEISWANVGDISKLWALYPNLESLTLQGAEIGLGKIAHDKLRTLTLRTGGLPTAALKSLAGAKLPALESLEVWTGSSSYGGESKFEDAAPLLSATRFPKLTHLGIRNSEYTAAIAQALPKSGILPRLKSLDLSMGTLKDDEADALLLTADAFAHLEKFDLSENLLTDKTTARLGKLPGEVKVLPQRQDYGDDDERRYVSVGE